MRRHRVFLIPSDHLGWSALRATLQAMEHVQVVDEATSTPQATAAIAALHPDVIIAAPRIGDEPIRHLLAKLRQTCCATTRFVLFAADLDPEDVLPFAHIGVAGYLLWSDLTAATLTCCLETVLDSSVLVRSPKVVQAFIETQQHLSDASPHGTPQIPAGRGGTTCERITRQQRKVLRLAGQGLTNDEIARDLVISSKTVKKHLEDVYKRLDAHDRETAARIAHERGYLS